MKSTYNISILGQRGMPDKRQLARFMVPAAAFIILLSFVSGALQFLTPDQQGYRLFEQGRFEQATEKFRDPMWLGTAYFKAGEYQKAAEMFATYDTAESSFNHGNSLLMQGKYEEAIERYERALELKPQWQDATVNLAIARTRAERLQKEGGEGTGGKLGADDIVFTEGKNNPEGGEEEVEGGQKLSDAEMREMWLHNVQTKPADFLRAKFSYQRAVSDSATDK